MKGLAWLPLFFGALLFIFAMLRWMYVPPTQSVVMTMMPIYDSAESSIEMNTAAKWGAYAAVDAYVVEMLTAIGAQDYTPIINELQSGWKHLKSSIKRGAALGLVSQSVIYDTKPKPFTYCFFAPYSLTEWHGTVVDSAKTTLALPIGAKFLHEASLAASYSQISVNLVDLNATNGNISADILLGNDSVRYACLSKYGSAANVEFVPASIHLAPNLLDSLKLINSPILAGIGTAAIAVSDEP